MTTDLMERARALTAELGQVPSQNRLKADLRLGTDRARTVRDALLREVAARRDARRALPAGEQAPAPRWSELGRERAR